MNTANLSRSTMLVSLTVRSYGAKKEDKKISADVARQHNVASDTGKYSKVLVNKKFLDPITKSVSALRAYFYENTLPWLDEGVRIMPSLNYEHAKAELSKLMDDYDAATRHFCAIFESEIIPDARERLNGMFDRSDYPVDIKGKFGVTVRYMPMPDAQDFRVDISEAARAEIAGQIEETMQEAQRAAMRDIWERVAETVKHMAERLALYKVTAGKAENHFRDTLVSNLRDLCALIPRLNFANDPNLEAIRKRIEAELLTETAQELRDDFKVRESVAAAADRISREIAEFMV